ncbi:MAG: hypothetical protein QM736_06505 [Vicinamibacterales bacterium]
MQLSIAAPLRPLCFNSSLSRRIVHDSMTAAACLTSGVFERIFSVCAAASVWSILLCGVDAEAVRVPLWQPVSGGGDGIEENAVGVVREPQHELRVLREAQTWKELTRSRNQFAPDDQHVGMNHPGQCGIDEHASRELVNAQFSCTSGHASRPL